MCVQGGRIYHAVSHVVVKELLHAIFDTYLLAEHVVVKELPNAICERYLLAEHV